MRETSYRCLRQQVNLTLTATPLIEAQPTIREPRLGSAVTRLCVRFQVFVEEGNLFLGRISPIVRLRDAVPFARIRNLGKRLARFLQRGCELLRFLRGNLGVLLTVHDQERRLDLSTSGSTFALR